MSKSHEFFLSPRWGEQDAFGHINNATYLRYFEEARVHWFQAIGWSITDSNDTGPVIASVHCDYRRPIHYPAKLRILSSLTRVGNSSFSVSQQLLDADSGALYTEADFKCVWVTMASGRPAAAPDFLTEQFTEVTRDD